VTFNQDVQSASGSQTELMSSGNRGVFSRRVKKPAGA
jgi:hypothetical protein